MINASTAIFAGKRRLRISGATMTAVILTSTSSQRLRKKRHSARKRWKAVQSKPSATTAPKSDRAVADRGPDGRKEKATALAECRHRCRADDCGLGQQRRGWCAGGSKNIRRARCLRTNRYHVHRCGNTG